MEEIIKNIALIIIIGICSLGVILILKQIDRFKPNIHICFIAKKENIDKMIKELKK